MAFIGKEYEIYGTILNIEKLSPNSQSYGRISLKVERFESVFIFFSETELKEKQLSIYHKGDKIYVIGKLIAIYGSISCTFELSSIKIDK